jgi:glycosidase
MDFPLQFAVAESLKDTNESWNAGMIKAYEALANDFLYADPDNLVVFPDNHDMDRFFTQVNEDVDLFKMGLVYFATVRGIPQLYYGTEIAMDNAGFPGDHGIIRTDFPGGWAGDKVNAFTGEGLSAMQREVQSFTRKLLNWRKGAPAVHHGKLIQFAPENGVYAFVRFTAAEKVMVLFNKNNAAYAQDMGKFVEVLGDATAAYEVMGGQKVDLSQPFKMQPKTAYILEISTGDE